MSTEQEKIKDLVKERYGARAERVISLTPAELDSDGCGCSTGSACCGVEDLDHAMLLYNEGQLAGLPTESIAAALTGLFDGLVDSVAGSCSWLNWPRGRSTATGSIRR